MSIADRRSIAGVEGLGTTRDIAPNIHDHLADDKRDASDGGMVYHHLCLGSVDANVAVKRPKSNRYQRKIALVRR
jgi:hypothetical protein